MRIKDIAIIGMLCAVIVAAKEAISFLPNIELVTLLIIVTTLVMGKKALFVIYVFVLIEGFLYGFGLHFIYYLYVWLVLFIVTISLKKHTSPLLWAMVSAFYGFTYGSLCSITHFIIGGPASGFAFIVSGIPFDIVHGVANFIIALALFKPLYYIMNKVYDRTRQTE